MKNKARRIVSVICALAMCAAMVPASVLAEDPPADTFSVEQTVDDASSSVPGTEGTTGGETETGPSLTGQEPGSEPDPDGTDTTPPPVVNSLPANEQPNDVTSDDPSAREPSTENVAQIGEGDNVQTFTSLDDAIAAAEDGDTIVLLADATTEGINLSKNLTISSKEGLAEKPTVTFTKNGIALWGVALTFKDCDIIMNGIGSTPYGEWTWMAICASANAAMTLDNVNMTMDATGVSNSPHAIYFCNNNILNLTNGTVLTIKNYPQDALEWDGGNGGYNVNITDSTFISDHNRSGFTGTFYATITNSTVKVVNSTGNGSNGSHFIIKDSNVNFDNNGAHGLSAGELSIDNSKVTANNNKGMGISVNNSFTVKNNSEVTVTGNASNTSYGYAAVRLYNDFLSSVDSTSKLYINQNYNTGLYVRQGSFVVEDGAVLEIMGNTVTHTLLDGYGGGVYVGYGDNYDPTVTLPADAKIYNNHALIGGDDIYVSEGVNGPSLTFGTVGSDWILDDCSEAITGWFDDSENDRWNGDDGDGICHAVEFTEFSNGVATVTGLHALKAAHGITATIDPADITVYMGGDNGYTSVLNGEQTENDVVTESSNSLPEPGFYITLPKDINTALQNAQVSAEGETADLSDYLSIRTQDGSRRWKLEPYGGNYSGAYDRFIYRILPADAGQAPVCLQFTSEDGSFYTSDIFEPAAAGALNQKYTMGIYPGLTDTSSVMLDVTIDDETYTCTVKLETGDLTIRYVTGEQDSVVTDVVEDIASTTDRSKAYAQTQPGTTFTINESRVDVTAAAAPSLLFDDVVTSGNTAGAQDYDVQLKDRAVQTVGVSFANLQYQAKYLDLVDANNGNVWLKASKPVTVYWPYPQGTDKNTTFYLVHFSDLNREMANSEIAGNIAASACEAVEVTNTDYGIAFEADSFSPYVLMWDNSTTAVSTPTPDEHPDIAEGIANGTWGGTPTPTPSAQTTVIPQTSDSLPLGMLIVVAVAAAGAVVVLLVLRKRRSR